MLIDERSPLRNLPLSADLRTKVFFDGIRFSIEIADLAYLRLRETLQNVSDVADQASRANEYVKVVADAWLLVDSLNRLRALCVKAPRISATAYCKKLIQDLAGMKMARNSVQHLDTRIEKIIGRKQPVWGVIGWVVVDQNPPKGGQVHSFVPGSFRPAEHHLGEIDGTEFEMPIDSITLFDGESTHKLSSLMKATRKFTREVEADLSNQFNFAEPSGRDLQITGEFSFNDSGHPGPRVSVVIK